MTENYYEFITIKNLKDKTGKHRSYYYLLTKKYDKESKSTVDIHKGQKCLGKARAYDKANPDYFFEKNPQHKPRKKLFLDLFSRMKEKGKPQVLEKTEITKQKPISKGEGVITVRKRELKSGTAYYREIQKRVKKDGKWTTRFVRYIGRE